MFIGQRNEGFFFSAEGAMGFHRNRKTVKKAPFIWHKKFIEQDFTASATQSVWSALGVKHCRVISTFSRRGISMPFCLQRWRISAGSWALMVL